MALLAACQPLPHPFADDRPPADLLAVPESAGVAVAPVEGEPKAIAAALGGATARALLGHDIPASDKTTSHGSYQLYGRLTQSQRDGQSAIAVRWRLEDPKGREIGERGVGIEAKPEDWRSAGTAMVERLAALSADAVAPLIDKEPTSPKLAALTSPSARRTEADTAPPGPPLPQPPPEKPAAIPETPGPPPEKPAIPAASTPPDAGRPQDRGRIRVALRRVTGAPGDGDTALADALKSVLRRQDIAIVDAGGKADFSIEGEVSVAPAEANKQHVKIVWRVRNRSGAELGTVGQENDVPRGRLSGPWGEVAFAVAMAASDGLSQVFANAAPSANPAGGPRAAAAPEAAAGAPQQPADTGSGPAKAKGRR